jgi:hypothetical protein
MLYTKECIFVSLKPWQAGEGRPPEGAREIPRNQRSEPADATIVPQRDVVGHDTYTGTLAHWYTFKLNEIWINSEVSISAATILR